MLQEREVKKNVQMLGHETGGLSADDASNPRFAQHGQQPVRLTALDSPGADCARYYLELSRTEKIALQSLKSNLARLSNDWQQEPARIV
jgi:hypothetical protein